MKLLGITGGIGAGKSVVTKCFSDLGAEIIDADAIARQVLKKEGAAYAEVISAFGNEILQLNHEIDRKKLAAIVFSDREKLQTLNQITHACVFQEMEKQIHQSHAELICLDVPLLFSCEFPFQCDKTLAVLAPKEQRIQRVIKRDACSREDVEVDIDIPPNLIAQSIKKLVGIDRRTHERGVVVIGVVVQFVDKVAQTEVARRSNVDVPHQSRCIGGVEKGRVHLVTEVGGLHEIGSAQFLC